MKNKKNNWLSRAIALLLPLLFLGGTALAQAPAATEPEMADIMRSNGKIYVVVAVLAIVLAGLLVYLIRLDGKVSRLEREVKDR